MKRFYCVTITIRDGESEYRDVTFISSKEELKPNLVDEAHILREYTGCSDLAYDKDDRGWVSLSGSQRIFDVSFLQEVNPEHIDILNQYMEIPVDVLVDHWNQESEKQEEDAWDEHVENSVEEVWREWDQEKWNEHISGVLRRAHRVAAPLMGAQWSRSQAQQDLEDDQEGGEK